MMVNPFWPDPQGETSGASASRLITEAEFAGVYAAAEFAWAFDLVLDQTVTIVWRLFSPDVEASAQAYFKAYLKALRDWLHERRQPQAWVYAHETGPQKGLHTHLAIYIHPNYRRDFKGWNQGWAARQMGHEVPRGIRVRGSLKATPWLHWLLVSYLLKGYDTAAIVQSGRNAPDRQDVLLGDLICFDWRDPGIVPLKKRVGWSESLGPARRAIGVPVGFDYLREPDPNTLFKDLFAERRAHHGSHRPYERREPSPRPFRSKYDDGVRDIRQLYPAEFLAHVSSGGTAGESPADTLKPADPPSDGHMSVRFSWGQMPKVWVRLRVRYQGFRGSLPEACD